MNTPTTTELLPQAWRSEAFAEDLPEADTAGPDEPGRRGRWFSVLLGVVPVLVATGGAVLAVLNQA